MDFEKALTLIQLANLTFLHPNLKPIHDAAMAELVIIANTKKQKATPRSVPSREETSELRRV